ncbi:hypothetical protein L602_000500000340 [Cupriavidus gilardii J11]|uniref:Uncharacterized protein n=1 Tax=Cupriavidus gilardii J11 TaxID=936133 RepID=A0A562B5S8_9BURK|nr:hypothetical protein L602_000500000340 [Cupriavidus gilardii J11]
MALHMISFAAGPAATSHMALSEAICGIGPAAQVLTSQWLLISRRSQAEILGELARYIDDKDTLIVASIDPAKLASYNLPDAVRRWLAMSLQRCGSTARADRLRASRGVSAVCKDFPD